MSQGESEPESQEVGRGEERSRVLEIEVQLPAGWRAGAGRYSWDGGWVQFILLLFFFSLNG